MKQWRYKGGGESGCQKSDKPISNGAIRGGEEMFEEMFLVRYTIHYFLTAEPVDKKQEMTRRELIELLKKGSVTIWEVKYKPKGGQ